MTQVSGAKPEGCGCASGDFYFKNYECRDLGYDADLGEVSVLQCKQCGQFWLRYFIEPYPFPSSGKWFCGPIDAQTAESATVENAKATLEGLDWYFRGGSFWGGVVVKAKSTLL